jgi:hypothetical protein
MGASSKLGARHISGLGILLVFSLALGLACNPEDTEGIGEVVKGLARSAPPAKTPELVDVGALYTWPTDDNFYSDGYGFTVVLKHGFANKLTIEENGQEIPRFRDAPDPSATTVYTIKDREQDIDTKVAITEIYIAPKPGGQPHGTSNTYRFTEISVNPDFAGTPDEVGEPLAIHVVVVTKPPMLAFFHAPSSVEVGQTVDVSWRANDCKQTELLENGSVIDRQLATGFAETIEGSKSVPIQRRTEFSLRASNAIGDVIQADAAVLATQPPPCPGNADGQPRYFTFCASCPGGSLGPYINEWTVIACTQSDAQEVVEVYNSNCTVTPGPCP